MCGTVHPVCVYSMGMYGYLFIYWNWGWTWMRGDRFRCVLCTEYRLDGGTWHPYGATRTRHAAYVDDAVWRARGADDDDARGAPVGFEYRIYVAYTSHIRRSASVACE